VRLRLGGRPGAPRRRARGVGVVAGPSAELGQFVVVGIGLAFGALGPGPQVSAQLVAVAGLVGTEAGQHLLRIMADPAGLRPSGLGGGLRAGGVLLRQPGDLFCLLDPC